MSLDTLQNGRLQVLYRYRSLRTECDRQRIANLLRHEHIYFARLDQLNDPFESRFQHLTEAPRCKKIRWFAEYLCRQKPGMTLAEAEATVRRDLPLERMAKVERENRLRIDALLARAGVLCFSEVCGDIKMWSHYSDSHSGICIGFRARTEEHLKFYEEVHRVKYTDTPPYVNMYTV